MFKTKNRLRKLSLYMRSYSNKPALVKLTATTKTSSFLHSLKKLWQRHQQLMSYLCFAIACL